MLLKCRRKYVFWWSVGFHLKDKKISFPEGGKRDWDETVPGCGGMLPAGHYPSGGIQSETPSQPAPNQQPFQKREGRLEVRKK